MADVGATPEPDFPLCAAFGGLNHEMVFLADHLRDRCELLREYDN